MIDHGRSGERPGALPVGANDFNRQTHRHWRAFISQFSGRTRTAKHQHMAGYIYDERTRSGSII
jgi:hypothetical protein